MWLQCHTKSVIQIHQTLKLVGHSESMNTVQCIQCDKLIYPEYLFYPIKIALLWNCLIIVTTSDFILPKKGILSKERKTRKRKRKKGIYCICKCIKL